MIEPRFQPKTLTFDLEGLLTLTGARVLGETGAPIAITGVGSLEWAGPADLACLDDPLDPDALDNCQAGACLVAPELASRVAGPTVALVSDEPARAFARVAAALFPMAGRPEPLFGSGVSAGAAVHPEAKLEQDVSVDPGAVIGPRAEIGRGAVIGANAVIGADVRIGRDSAVGHGAIVMNALIGDRVTLQPGASIGHAGPTVDQALQLGRVIVQDDVIVGANSAIARGPLGDTVVGEKARIDALVEIGSDVVIGRHSVIFAGSSVGDRVELPDFSVLRGARGASSNQTRSGARPTAPEDGAA